jgi:hypothetical protein
MDWPRHAHRRGHLLHQFADLRWRWADTGRFAGRVTPRTGDRPCSSGGHGGAVQPYVAREDGTVEPDDDVVWPPGVPRVRPEVWRGTDAAAAANDVTGR